MALQRIDRMSEPPVVGRWYMVPCVFAKWREDYEYWPVVGHEHDDLQFFNFPYRHYHVDARFLTRPQRLALGYYVDRLDPERVAEACISQPLQTNDRGCNVGGLPTLQRKRCSMGPIQASQRILDAPNWNKLASHYAGQQCRQGRRGWICPHQNVALGNVAAINGVIHCPLHGLRIDAVTGICLGSLKSQTRGA